MSALDALGFWANIPRLKAGRVLDDIRRSGQKVSADYLFDLVLAYTGSREQAERTAIEQRKVELRTGETPL